MRPTPSLVTAAVSLVLLSTLSACGPDSGDDAKALPSAKTLKEAQEFIAKAGLPCTSMTTDEGAHGTPAEGFLGTTDDYDSPQEKREAAAWKIGEAGFCGDTRAKAGGWIVYLPKDMKAFQQNYRKTALAADKEYGDKYSDLRTGRFLIGADFVVNPTNSLRTSGLLETGLLIENCDPDLKVPTGYRKQDASAAGCVLTDYVPS
ncbi:MULTISPECIES: hypothetical protein [Streptomyces]|uniref:Secreted protein n=3 Tax=Streptomyces avermitilis TaxID=33903 RepID=Q82EW6_STRAW|nr:MULTISPECIES: hypothetical protein [Streptomyces]KUN51519.1 hypothetical protein AQJ43_26385 [Streptomyces avermitilis]MYT00083.1 hypothetical protein [Streptomyces sp. SID5469]OOV31711.1 hypothetical protein SM007_01995 [Streptomyces avermitilis]BAC72209.1 putative secreted protein [Streptomyces avermitilis MA-4680 = NBRC 14893]BBJ52520.1 hypothetical protein SAVMC3_51490 [Streptomyces avermitilis]